MGIKQLSKLLKVYAPNASTMRDPKNFLNRVLAIDASMSLYQFMISIRRDGNSSTVLSSELTNLEGKNTGHLLGMFYRTIRLLESGIKPVYVFDGKPPKLKRIEIKKRVKAKKAAKEKEMTALKTGDLKTANRMKKRSVCVSSAIVEETIALLKFMGVPVIRAPSEAEAQCAAMCKQGTAFAVVTEDMDALTFGSTLLVRNLFKADGRNVKAVEYSLDLTLQELRLTMDEFIDVCILCGCDYTRTIVGIGPERALDGIRRHKSIEAVIEKRKITRPENFLFERAREIFKNPKTVDTAKMKLAWKKPDEKGLLELMVTKNGFTEEKIKNGLARIKKAKKLTSQTRLENYFSALPKVLGKKKKTTRVAVKIEGKRE